MFLCVGSLPRAVPSVILDDSRDLTGGVPSWWSRRRLCRSCDFVHTVLSFAFAFAFAFLALVVECAALACVLEPAIFGHVANTSAYEATRL